VSTVETATAVCTTVFQDRILLVYYTVKYLWSEIFCLKIPGNEKVHLTRGVIAIRSAVHVYRCLKQINVHGVQNTNNSTHHHRALVSRYSLGWSAPNPARFATT
jgi:hypothetical protein